MPIVPPVSPSGTLQYYWIDPGGTTHDLTYETSPTLFVSKGATGLGDVDVEIAEDKIPFAAGGLFRHIAVPPRDITLPISAREDSLGDLVLVADALRSWFATGDERRLTPGTFGVIRPDDSVREIQCYRTGGLAGDMDTGSPIHLLYVVSLRAPDPYPTAAADVVHTYGSADFGDEQIIINAGELDAYPIWTMLGPWSAGTPSIQITNTVTLETFSFAFALTLGLGVIVDTRPPSTGRTNQAVRRYPDDLNLYSFIGPNSDLWWLAPGENRFQIDLAGGVTADTSVELRYLPRYRGLLR